MSDYVLCKDCEHAPANVMEPFAECQNPEYVCRNYRDGSVRGIACHLQNYNGMCQGFTHQKDELLDRMDTHTL